MSHSLQPHVLQHARLFCLHYLQEFAQILVHWVSDAIQQSHPQLPHSPFAFHVSHHQGHFQWVNSTSGGQSTGASASALSLLWIFRVGFLQDWLVWSPCCPSDSQESSPVPQFESTKAFFGAQPFYGPILTFIHDYWKKHSFDYMDLCQQSDISAFNTLSRFVIAFIPRSKHLLISLLQSLSSVILESKK